LDQAEFATSDAFTDTVLTPEEADAAMQGLAESLEAVEDPTAGVIEADPALDVPTDGDDTPEGDEAAGDTPKADEDESEMDEDFDYDAFLRDLGKAAVAEAGIVCARGDCASAGVAHFAHPEEGWL